MTTIDRATRRVSFAKLLRRLLVEHGVEQSQIAAVLGVTHQDVSRWCDASEKKSLPAFDIEALPPVILDALLRTWAEQRGYVLAPAVDAPDIADDLRALAEVASTGGEMTAAYASSLADGSISAAEADRIERAADGVIAAAAAVKERVRPAQVERVVAIRRAAK